ncbi:MAG: hypothetical protein IT267_09710 [Saprospiraceae bacterium]|nr:hypothetical protein [Saprospiraceae bacterium]
MKYIILFITFNLLVLLFVVIFLRPFYTSTSVYQFTPLKSIESTTFDTSMYQNLGKTKRIQIDSITKFFILTDNYHDIQFISQITDSLIRQNVGSELDALQQFSMILNDKNMTWKAYSFSEKALDTLFAAYTWANNFKTLGIVSNGSKKIFNQVIYDYWMTEIVRNLESIAEMKPSIGYTIKFKVLRSLCEASNYSPTIKTSSIDKVLYNTENSRFNYILGRFYLVFGNLGIFLAASVFIITLVSYFHLFIQLKTYFKNAKR